MSLPDRELMQKVHLPGALFVAQQLLEGGRVHLPKEGRDVELEFILVAAIVALDCENI